jgi:serine phosphatase RsbU (regulator of sigma subunit)
LQRARETLPFSPLVARILRMDSLPQHMVLSFNDAYAELDLWVNGRWVGATSRHLLPSQKPFYFMNTEAIPIPDQLLGDNRIQDTIVVRASRFSDVQLPPVFRVNAFALFEVSQFILLESIALLSIVVVEGAILFLALYHLAIWLRRRDDWSNLAFLAPGFGVPLQAFFFYNFSGYFNISAQTTWTWRMVFVHNTPVVYLAFAVFAGVPLSYVWQYLRAGENRSKTAFASFGWFRKISACVGEVTIYVIYPLIMLLALVLPLSVSSLIVYKFSVPMTLILNTGLTVAMARWFYLTSKKRNLGYALPVAIGVAVMEGGVVSGMLGALGVRQLSGLAIGYALGAFTILFAIALANQFQGVYMQLGRLKGRLEHVLAGTKELTSVHEVLPVATTAAQYIVREIDMSQSGSVALFLFGNTDDKTGERLCEKWPILVDGKKVETAEREAVNFNEMPVAKKALADRNALLTPESELVLPILNGESEVGFMTFEGYPSDELHAEDAHFANTLASSLAIALENISFLQETAEKARLEAELGAAKAVQEALLPASWDIPGLELAGIYEAAAQTGGDWYGFHHHTETKTVDFFVGDVTGHGIPAALLTGVICGTLYSLERLIDQNPQDELSLCPDKRIQTLAGLANTAVRTTGNRSQLLMTMVFLSLNMETGEVVYLNAAHNGIYLRQCEGGKTKLILNPGNRLGYAEAPVFKLRSFTMAPGDSLLFYTDGLIENSGPERGSVFSEAKLRKIFLEVENPQACCDAVMECGRSIWQDVPPADDIAVMVCRWCGPGQSVVEAAAVTRSDSETQPAL